MPADTAPNNRKWIYMAGAFVVGAAGAALVMSMQSSNADVIKAGGIDAKERAAIEAIVEEYILENPEILPRAIERLQQRDTLKKLSSIREEVETPYASAFAGNANGDVVVVKFSDYACGYCRQAVADVSKLIASDTGVKVVFRDFPILSPASTDAAVMALAAAEQGKYYGFYKAMFGGGRPNADSIRAAATTAGLDMAAAEAFVASGKGEKVIGRTNELARQLEFTGTPAWVVGDRVLVGAVGYDELAKAVAEARRRKK